MLIELGHAAVAVVVVFASSLRFLMRIEMPPLGPL